MEVTGIRYTMPFLPAVALITATGIMQISVKKIKNFLIIAAVIFGIFQLISVSYPIFSSHSFKEIVLPVHLPERIKRHRMFPENIIIFNAGPWAISGSDYGLHPIKTEHFFSANEEIF